MTQISPSLIVARTPDRVIGHQGRKPWTDQKERETFKRLTHHRPLIIGRKTFHAMQILAPQSWYIVVSRDKFLLKNGSFRDFGGFGYWFVSSLEQAFTMAEGLAGMHHCPDYFIIGGADIFNQALNRVHYIYETELHHNHEGDTLFPTIKTEDWEIQREDHFPAEKNTRWGEQTFRILKRKTV